MILKKFYQIIRDAGDSLSVLFNSEKRQAKEANELFLRFLNARDYDSAGKMLDAGLEVSVRTKLELNNLLRIDLYHSPNLCVDWKYLKEDVSLANRESLWFKDSNKNLKFDILTNTRQRLEFLIKNDLLTSNFLYETQNIDDYVCSTGTIKSFLEKDYEARLQYHKKVTFMASFKYQKEEDLPRIKRKAPSFMWGM